MSTEDVKPPPAIPLFDATGRLVGAPLPEPMRRHGGPDGDTFLPPGWQRALTYHEPPQVLLWPDDPAEPIPQSVDEARYWCDLAASWVDRCVREQRPEHEQATARGVLARHREQLAALEQREAPKDLWLGLIRDTEVALEVLLPLDPRKLTIAQIAETRAVREILMAMLRRRAQEVGPLHVSTPHGDFSRGADLVMDALGAFRALLAQTPKHHRPRVQMVLSALAGVLVQVAAMAKRADGEGE